MNKVRIKSIIFLIVLITVILSFSQPLFAYLESYIEVFGNYPPYTLSYGCCPLNNWPQINSKWNQPRNDGTSPHQGVDVYAVSGTPVYAVWNGWVEWKDTDKIRFRIDINKDGVKNDTLYYCDYYHLSSRKPSGYYAMAAQIGNSGGTPAHLHFGVLDSSGRWCRNEVNYRFTSYWNSGRDVDVFSREQWSSATCQITIYFKDNGVTKYPDEVRIYHRKNGTSTWTDGGAMTKSGSIYSYNFSGKYPSGTTINWLVRIRRGDQTGDYYRWCFAPAKYDHPNINPNATSYKYAYFTKTLP